MQIKNGSISQTFRNISAQSLTRLLRLIEKLASLIETIRGIPNFGSLALVIDVDEVTRNSSRRYVDIIPTTLEKDILGLMNY